MRLKKQSKSAMKQEAKEENANIKALAETQTKEMEEAVDTYQMRNDQLISFEKLNSYQ